MELKSIALIALCACVPQAKRLVLPEDMRRPGVGPAVPGSGGEIASRASVEKIDAFAAADPLTATTRPKAQLAAAQTPAPATPGGAKKPEPPAPLRQPATSPTPPEQKYVLRLVEHGRVWEVELPEETGGYEVRIPLGPPIEQPTLADQELMGKEQKQAPSRSYLSTLAKVAEMYDAHHYELALIELVELEQQFPKEARIAAMKGSLYHKLGKAQLARDAWKKALELDPSDAAVAEALGGLKEE